MTWRKIFVTGKACGSKTAGAQYCRPSKRVSTKTPTTRNEISPSKRGANIERKEQWIKSKKV